VGCRTSRHFTPEELLPAVGDGAAIVALGRIGLHTADRRLIRQMSELAKVMLEESSPGVRRHATRLLALLAMDQGDATAARERLCALDIEERRSTLPRLPIDLTDEIQLVRIAIAAGDRELAEHGVAPAERRANLNPAAPMTGIPLIDGGATQPSRANRPEPQSPTPVIVTV
jgi:hypothetical protein